MKYYIVTAIVSLAVGFGIAKAYGYQTCQWPNVCVAK